MRNTYSRPEVVPLVNPAGHFVFSPIASNLRDGLLQVELVEGEPVARMSMEAEKRGFFTIEQVADDPKQAAALTAGLLKSYNSKGGHTPVPDSLLPAKVKAMRAKKAKTAESWDESAKGKSQE
jgi:hypothetical protein